MASNMSDELDRFLNLYDFEMEARRILSTQVWGFIEAGTYEEYTLKRNRTALDAVCLRPRFMVDVRERDATTTVMGHKIDFPVMIAPAGHHGIAHRDGECAVVRAAGEAGTIMGVGADSNYTLEEIASQATAPVWFQLYHRNRELSEMLLRRAVDAGYSAIMVTVDNPIPGTKERDIRNRYRRPEGLELANFVGEEAGLGLVKGTPEAQAWEMRRLPVRWEDVAWVKSVTSLPLIIKGIRTPADALGCVQRGVDGIVVSNHGARQLDGSHSSIETLPDIVDAVNGRAEVYLDSGIRRGTDVLKALSLGAKAVFIGRPLFWGLAVGGEAGVSRTLEILRAEFDRAIGYCGVTGVDEIGPNLVSLPGQHGWV